MSRHATCYIRGAGPVGHGTSVTPDEEQQLAAEPKGNGAARESSEQEREPQHLDDGVLASATTSDAESGAALALARRIVDLTADKLASDIVLLDIRGVSPIADYFVICTAGSERQTAAILKDLSDTLLVEQQRKPLHTEGPSDSGWVLLDYGDVITHVFSPAQRAFYNLEELWAAATPVVRLQ